MVTENFKRLIPSIQSYFQAQPVKKVWLFGSCSRGEEGQNSDIDLLVIFDEDAHVSLLTMGGMYMDLKQLTGREIDLVEEGTLLPFASSNVEHDKILIYERKD